MLAVSWANKTDWFYSSFKLWYIQLSWSIAQMIRLFKCTSERHPSCGKQFFSIRLIFLHFPFGCIYIYALEIMFSFLFLLSPRLYIFHVWNNWDEHSTRPKEREEKNKCAVKYFGIHYEYDEIDINWKCSYQINISILSFVFPRAEH